MSVLVLDGEKLDDFIQKLVFEIKSQLKASSERKWIDGEEVMSLLGIKSKTTLQKIRDEGKSGTPSQSHVLCWSSQHIYKDR